MRVFGFKSTFFTIVACCTFASAHNVLDFGAIPFEITNGIEYANSVALLNAIMAANSTDNTDNTVLVPAG